MANMLFIFPPGEVNPEIQDMIGLPLAAQYTPGTWAYSLLTNHWYYVRGSGWVFDPLVIPPGEIELAMLLLK